MNCPEASRRMSGAALEPGRFRDDRAFRSHLAHCPACRDEYARACAIASAVGSARPAAPRQLVGRLALAGRTEMAARKRAGRRLQLALTGAMAVAAGLLLALGLLRPKRAAEPEAAGCGDWCFVQGDPGNCRRGEPVSGLMPDTVVWTRSIPGVPGQFKPLAWQGLVIANAAPERRTSRGGGRLVAFDAETGEPLWRRDFASGDFGKTTGFPDRCIRDGRLYVTDGRGCLVLEARTGRDVAALDPPEGVAGWSYLTASGGRLVGTSGDGRTVFSVDAASGRELWRRTLAGPVSVPALAEGRLLLHTDRGTLLALDAREGSELWRTEGSAPSGPASLHARAGRGVVLARSGEILAFSTADGRPAWRKHLGGPPGPGLAMSADAIYLQGGNRALALSDGFTLWYQEPGAGGCSPPTVVGRELLASPGPDHGGLAVLSPAGQVLGTVDQAAAEGCGGAIVSRGRIIAVGGGRLLAVRCRAGG